MFVCESESEGSSSSTSAGGPLAASHARSFQPLRRCTTVTTSRGGTTAGSGALRGGARRGGVVGPTGACAGVAAVGRGARGVVPSAAGGVLRRGCAVGAAGAVGAGGVWAAGAVA